MNRRTLIRTVGAATLALPFAAHAQSARKLARIGFLNDGGDMMGAEPRSPVTKAFLRGLRDLGYVYGEHFVTEPRGATLRPQTRSGWRSRRRSCCARTM